MKLHHNTDFTKSVDGCYINYEELLRIDVNMFTTNSTISSQIEDGITMITHILITKPTTSLIFE